MQCQAAIQGVAFRVAMVVIVAPTIAGCQANQPTSVCKTRPASPEGTKRSELPAAPESQDSSAAEHVLRAACVLELDRALREPAVDLVFDEEPFSCFETWPDSETLITFYFGNYAVDLPRSLFGSIRNPLLFRTGVTCWLQGRCSFHVWVDEPLGLATELRDLADDYLLASERLPDLDGDPGFAARFACEVATRLEFANDYELVRALFSTRYSTIKPETISVAELYTTAALASTKAIIAPTSAHAYRALVETPYLHGFAWGSPTIDDRFQVDLHDRDRVVRLTLACLEHLDAKATNLAPHVRRIVGSIRHHHSPTPGADLLAAARRELDEPADAASADIARSLVLCASRYDDAYAAAVALGESLVSPDEHFHARYMYVLHRVRE